MEVILLNDDNRKLWKLFCQQSNDAWFWHTTDWMDYVLQYRPDFNSKQKSFFIMDNNEIVAICPLIFEIINGRREFCFSGFGVPTPALANNLLEKRVKKIQDFIFEYIENEAHSLGVNKISFRFSPLAPNCLSNTQPITNYLMRYGYLDATFNTQILDLTPTYEELKTEIRKGHKYDINRTAKTSKIFIYDSESITREVYNAYCDLHHKDAGRITRPQITFDLMYDYIKRGDAFLTGSKLNGSDNYSGFGYFYLYKNGVYYGSGCSDPDLGDLPIAHYIIWETAQWLKKKNINYFELGWQFFGQSFHNDASVKECTISKFKRGFGGKLLPQIIAEKYFDVNTFDSDYSKKMNRYKDFLKSNSSTL